MYIYVNLIFPIFEWWCMHRQMKQDRSAMGMINFVTTSEGSIPFSQNWSNVPGVPTTRSTGDWRSTFINFYNTKIQRKNLADKYRCIL